MDSHRPQLAGTPGQNVDVNGLSGTDRCQSDHVLWWGPQTDALARRIVNHCADEERNAHGAARPGLFARISYSRTDQEGTPRQDLVIDLSALEVLEAVNERLAELGIQFHLTEVKGPVMDGLEKTDFLDQLNGRVFLSQHQAIEELK